LNGLLGLLNGHPGIRYLVLKKGDHAVGRLDELIRPLDASPDRVVVRAGVDGNLLYVPHEMLRGAVGGALCVEPFGDLVKVHLILLWHIVAVVLQIIEWSV